MLTTSVITPTCDRPVAFALAEHYLARQTAPPDEWIVADGGQTPVPCTFGQTHLHRPQPPGPRNFAANLLAAVAIARGDLIVVWEDDDWYHPDHLARLVGRLLDDPAALLAGDPEQRYYNLARSCWRRFVNTGASLCQTAFRRSLVPLFAEVVAEHAARSDYGIDTRFWTAVPRAHWALAHDETVVGIKGLPGQAGLGIGHRPTGPAWIDDASGQVLQAWLGTDAGIYQGLEVRA